ncbi:MAG: acyltransferase family protein [Halanaerobiaceae bacterium]
MKKKRIEELDILRSIAIMTVVIVHAITRVLEIHQNQGMLKAYQGITLLTLRLFTTFGTPIFVFLSVFLLSYAYYDEIPENFMEKRIKLILIPYISMCFIYAFIMIHENGAIGNGNTLLVYLQYVLKNMFTGFYRHGYFILVIFQFYIIYMLFQDRIKKIKPIKLLTITFIINITYLGFFNFIDPDLLPHGDLILKVATWHTFPAWIFYFAIGYSSGSNIKMLRSWLNKYKKLIIPSIFTFGGFMGYMYLSGSLMENSSKRFDMLLFSSSMFLLIFYFSTKLQKPPALLKFISRYSFGIYLFHMIYLYLATYLFSEITFIQVNPFITLVFLIISSTSLSILTTYLLDKISIGKYLIGRLEKS